VKTDPIGFGVGPTVLGWRIDPLYRRDGKGLLVHGEKKGTIEKLMERFF
jgi:hypothetical protein